MVISISFQCNSYAEARELIAAAERLTKLPYRLEGFGLPVVEEPAPVPQVHSAFGIAEPAPIIRGNVDPGEPTITKIGAETKDRILAALQSKQDVLPKYTEHLKLLWKRGDVRFDGERYYI